MTNKEKKIAELEAESRAAGFWDDQRQAQEKMRLTADLREQVTTWQHLDQQVKDTLDLIEMSLDDDDKSMQGELTAEVLAISERLETLEFKLSLSGKHDRDGAVLSIHAGAGGTEGCDWTEMLLRMYLRWCEAGGYKTLLVDETPGEETGLKSVSIEVGGEYAYGYLKAERGVHRLVRISPFDASKRRHTTFALVEVIPNLENDIDIEVKQEDLEIDVYKSGGAGGQHVQKNSTAIRMRHIPTGIVVTCQNERSQLQNRETALKILKGKLYDMELQKQEAEQARLKGQHVEAGWGNQIRSYVLHPYKMVKDHRTNYEVGNAEAVLDGSLDDFIQAYLRYNIGQDE